MNAPGELVTVQVCVWFGDIHSEVDLASDEVRAVLVEAIQGPCKTAFEEVLAKINAKDVEIRFIAY